MMLGIGLTGIAGCQFDPTGLLPPRGGDGSVDTGADQIVASQTRVTLVGAVADRELRGETLQYEWRQVEGSPVEIDDPRAAITSFIAPQPADDSETLVFELRVTAGDEVFASTHQVTILDADQTLLDPLVFVSDGGADGGASDGPSDVDDGATSAFTLVADGDLAAAFGQTVTLGATIKPQTRKADVIKWRQIGGEPVELIRADTLTPSFVAPARSTSIFIRLTVASGQDVRSADFAVYVTPRGGAGP